MKKLSTNPSFFAFCKGSLWGSFLFFLSVFYCTAQQEKGKPFLVNYTPQEYKAHVQNWDLVQDHRGVLYFGNGDGIMEYDGVNFRIIPLPNRTTARSLAVDSTGKVFGGAVNDFGYLQPDSAGNMQFVSLLPLIPDVKPNFNDIWGTTTLGDEVYFRCYSKLFRYKKGKITVWDAIEEFSADFVFQNQYYITDDSAGICYIEGDELIEMRDKQFFHKYGFNTGIECQNNMYIGTSSSGVYRLPPGFNNYSRIKVENEDKFISKRLYCGTKTQSNNLAWGYNGYGCVIMDLQGNISQVITKKTGLQNMNVYGLNTDAENALWLALNNGLSRAEISLPITYWDKNSGLAGTVEAIIRHKGMIYITTHRGIFYIDENNQIQSLGNIDNQCWCFLEFSPESNPEEKRLLVGIARKLYEIKDFKLFEIEDYDSKVVFELYRSRKEPDIVYTLLSDALGVVRYENGKWISEGLVEGVEGNIRAGAQDKNGDLWLGTFRNGVIRVVTSDNPLQPKEVKRYNDKHGIPSLKNVLTYHFDNHVIIATEGGMYRFDAENDRFIPDTTIGKQFCDGSRDIFCFQELDNGDVWMSGLNNRQGEIGVARKTGENQYEWYAAPFKRIPEMMVLGIYAEENGNCWIGGSEGLFLFQPREKDQFIAPYSTLIRKVLVGEDSLVFNGTYFEKNDSLRMVSLIQPDCLKPELEYKDNSISFYYSAPSFSLPENNQFSYFLEGYDKNWSQWTTMHHKEYTNLPEGDYIFRVKSRNIYENEGKEANFEFTILSPWYRTYWAYVLYVILSVGLVYLIVKLNTRRLKAANERLEMIVNERTAEIRKKNKEITQRNEEILVQNAQISQQKEEIQAQAEQLEETNRELEKLSVVASETDNVVFIFDQNLNLEWVNPSFTRIYGYNLTEYIRKFGNNLLQTSTNPSVKKAINRCLETKKSVVYESSNQTKEGTKIWVHTTLTPILDIDDEVEKLIAIDSDISKLKEAEEEILQQKEEIQSQAEQLERTNKELHVTNEQVKRQNEHIRGSIRYAQTIQNAILPIKENIQKWFDVSIIYYPKDIVSGDFYWFTQILDNGKPTNMAFLAVVDCTGHGVPGAFMSMIGSRLLSEIIVEKKIYDPATILKNLNNEILIALKQQQTDNNDGMDVCLCRFEQLNDRQKLVFAGAKRPLFFLRENTDISIFKGDRKSIGGIYSKRVDVGFTNHEVMLRPDDVLYLTTDGFIDQNSPMRKRFGTRNFIKLLENYKNKSLDKQNEILLKALHNHQQDELQRDDITILGVKIRKQ